MYDAVQENDVNLAIRIFRGLDKASGNNLLQEGMSDKCQNWRFNKKGWIVRRPTFSKYNGTSLGPNPIKYIKRIYIGTNKYLLAVYDTTLKVGNDTAGTFSNLKTGLTTDTPWNGVTYKNFHYLGNGYDENIKTNGVLTTTAGMGCGVMSSVPTIKLSACNSLLDTAVYKYKFNWEYDGYQESNVSAYVTISPSAACSAVQLYGFENYPTNATHMNIYRTEGGGSIYYSHSRHTVGQVSSWVSASPYVDNTADSGLDTTVTGPTDNGAPAKSKFFLLHKDRLFLAGDISNKSRVIFSEISGVISYPDVFPVSNYVPVAEDDGDEIMGLAHDPMGYLCVFKKKGIFKIFTDGDPSLWSVSDKFSPQRGCISSQSIAETPQGIIYLSHDGWMIFNGQSSSFLSNSDNVNSLVQNEISLSRLGKCVGHYHNGICYLAYTDKAENVTYNNKVLIYDTATNNFGIDTKNVESFTNFDGGDDWGGLYYGDSVNGYIYQEELTLSDLVYSKVSDFTPNGTLSSLVCYNTESDPYLELGGHFTWARMAPSSWADYPSGSAPSAWRDFPSAYSISGLYFSSKHQINAKNLYYLYWNEELGDKGNVTLALRTSNTSAGLSGSFGTEYTNPGGSDITAETAQDWIQFRVTMSAIGVSATSACYTPRIYSKDGYAIKLTYGVGGSSVENSMYANWRGGYNQVTPEGNIARLRRFHVDHDGTAGNLSCIWDVDEGALSGIFNIDLASHKKDYYAPFPLNAFGRRVRLEYIYENIADLTLKAVNILYSPQPERYA